MHFPLVPHCPLIPLCFFRDDSYVFVSVSPDLPVYYLYYIMCVWLLLSNRLCVCVCCPSVICIFSLHFMWVDVNVSWYFTWFCDREIFVVYTSVSSLCMCVCMCVCLYVRESKTEASCVWYVSRGFQVLSNKLRKRFCITITDAFLWPCTKAVVYTTVNLRLCNYVNSLFPLGCLLVIFNFAVHNPEIFSMLCMYIYHCSCVPLFV